MKDRRIEFLKELKALLEKYSAEIEIDYIPEGWYSRPFIDLYFSFQKNASPTYCYYNIGRGITPTSIDRDIEKIHHEKATQK